MTYRKLKSISLINHVFTLKRSTDNIPKSGIAMGRISVCVCEKAGAGIEIVRCSKDAPGMTRSAVGGEALALVEHRLSTKKGVIFRKTWSLEMPLDLCNAIK